ncbi:15580_t:CDS:2 [Acaulospora morrowiae]|uniref:15580_t:CDS:1 n=1 Tax=Acaulospora morrowiae TaxID=94023 RepID=A0A9N9CGU5_9GLOM|nr:15580_t:CDS:2 [Acaulospora morrowiae]
MSIELDKHDKRIILNVGGFRYETLCSTLRAYPQTLLGTMFHERNNALLHPTNGNEYFFDRNGRAFHYILEYYRTGEIVWPNDEPTQLCACTQVTKKELFKELDYFQIPLSVVLVPNNLDDNKILAMKLDDFVEALSQAIIITRQNFQSVLNLSFFNIRSSSLRIYGISSYDYNRYEQKICLDTSVDKLLRPYLFVGYNIMDLFRRQIENHIKNRMSSIKWHAEITWVGCWLKITKDFNVTEILRYSNIGK